jgi:hypothetical protein
VKFVYKLIIDVLLVTESTDITPTTIVVSTANLDIVLDLPLVKIVQSKQ